MSKDLSTHRTMRDVYEQYQEWRAVGYITPLDCTQMPWRRSLASAEADALELTNDAEAYRAVQLETRDTAHANYDTKVWVPPAEVDGT